MRTKEISSKFLVEVISKIENFLGKFKNFKLRLYQETPPFSGVYVDNKLKYKLLKFH